MSNPRRPHLARQAIPAMLALPLLLLLSVPILLLVSRTTPGALAAELQQRETQQAIALSLATSTAALLVTLVFGTPLAYWLSCHRSRLSAIVETLVDLPTVLPPSVAGVALLLTLGRNGPFGNVLDSLGIELAFTPAAVVIAQVFVASPYYVRAARAGFSSIESDVVMVSIIDGASAWQRLRSVLLPQAAPSLLAGAAMCWSRAIGEFGATILFAGNMPGYTQTMPLAVYMGFQGGLERALVLSTVLVGLSLAVLLSIRLTGWRPPAPGMQS